MPEKQLTYEQQLQLVTDRFGGKDAVAVTRGDEHLLATILGAMIGTASPTECVEHLRKKFAGALYVAGHMARFNRDRHTVAFDTAVAFIKDRHFRLPGHDHPIEDTRLVTVLVFDFELLRAIARWIRVQPHHHLERSCLPDVLDSLTESVASKLPTLQKNSGTTPAGALGLSYHDEVKRRFPKALAKIGTWIVEDGETSAFGPNRRVYGLPIFGNERAYRMMAYVFNMPQDQVLREFFPRAVQSEVATWQLRVPKALWEDLDIGFHPEEFHGKLKMGGVLPSLGVSHGYGAAWLSRDLATMPRYLRSMDLHPAEKPWMGLEKCDEGDPLAFVLRK